MKRTGHKFQLPADFADKLLDAEIQFKLSDPPSKLIIKTLIQLYSMGVEYYESIRSHKYLYFQLKMNELFVSSATITAINDKNTEDAQSPLKKKMKSNLQQQKIEAFKIKQKQQKMMKEVLESTQEKVSAIKVKEILNDNDVKKKAHQQKIKSELTTQDNKLKEKIERRKSRLQFSKSFTNADLGEERQTKDTLFPEGVELNKIKPLEVDFTSIINQNDSDEEADEATRRRMSVISNGQGKKAKSELDLFQRNQR